MDREIKFRVWLGERFWFFDIHSGFNAENEGQVCGPEQYTGLKDKNGKEIFEGDIVTYGYYDNDEGLDDLNRPMNFSVRWSSADGGWVANGRLGDWDKNGIYPFEIIGNIHQDSHLLSNN